MTASVSLLDGIEITRVGTGPPVVMVHGSAQGGRVSGQDYWRYQLPLADRGWELVLPSRPGHGPSPTRGPEDLEVDAVWVAELLGDGAHLVGHSYGAAIAMCAAGLRPEAVSSLTLVEPPLYFTAADRPEAIALRDGIHDALDTRFPLLAVRRFMKVAGIPRGIQKPRPRLRDVRAIGRGARTLRDPATWDERPAVGRVRDAGIPVLSVDGGWSPGFDAITDELASAMGGRQVSLPAGHHFPHMAATADQFNNNLHEFLTETTHGA